MSKSRYTSKSKKSNAQEVKKTLEQLEQGVKDLHNSEAYKHYLTTLSKFHRYSYNNVMLIGIQNPHASHVAGYSTWKKMGRNVMKGSKAIRIIAPSPHKISKEIEKLDTKGQVVKDASGKPITEIVEQQRLGFRFVNVFDISQTSGKDLGLSLVKKLEGDSLEAKALLKAIEEISPFPIAYKETGTANGYCDIVNKEIAIKESLSTYHKAKTGVHEVSHALLHADVRVGDRGLEEVQAESVAYTVCNHFGIDSSDYSFGYISSWASDKDLTELKSSLDIIGKTSSKIINSIESILEKEMMITKEPLVFEIVDCPNPDSYFEVGQIYPYNEFQILIQRQSILNGELMKSITNIEKDYSKIQEAGLKYTLDLKFNVYKNGELLTPDAPINFFEKDAYILEDDLNKLIFEKSNQAIDVKEIFSQLENNHSLQFEVVTCRHEDVFESGRTYSYEEMQSLVERQSIINEENMQTIINDSEKGYDALRKGSLDNTLSIKFNVYDNGKLLTSEPIHFYEREPLLDATKFNELVYKYSEQSIDIESMINNQVQQQETLEVLIGQSEYFGLQEGTTLPYRDFERRLLDADFNVSQQHVIIEFDADRNINQLISQAKSMDAYNYSTFYSENDTMSLDQFKDMMESAYKDNYLSLGYQSVDDAINVLNKYYSKIDSLLENNKSLDMEVDSGNNRLRIDSHTKDMTPDEAFIVLKDLKNQDFIQNSQCPEVRLEGDERPILDRINGYNIRKNTSYDCHFKEWDMSQDDLSLALKDLDIDHTWAFNKVGIRDLTPSQLVAVRDLAVKNGSVLIVDKVNDPQMCLPIVEGVIKHNGKVVTTPQQFHVGQGLAFCDISNQFKHNGFDVIHELELINAKQYDFAYLELKSTNNPDAFDKTHYSLKEFEDIRGFLKIQLNPDDSFKRQLTDVNIHYKNASGNIKTISTLISHEEPLLNSLNKAFDKKGLDYNTMASDYTKNRLLTLNPNATELTFMKPETINTLSNYARNDVFTEDTYKHMKCEFEHLKISDLSKGNNNRLMYEMRDALEDINNSLLKTKGMDLAKATHDVMIEEMAIIS